jgi:parvulin-like peptidyl-prolyl isomerase
MPKQFTKQETPRNILSITYWRKFASHRLAYIFLAGIFGFGMIAYFAPRTPGGSNGRGQAVTERSQEAIATVNGEAIPRMQYENQWGRYKQSFGGMGEAQQASFQGMVINGLVQGALERSIAKKKGLSVSDADIEKEIARMKVGPDGKPITDDKFQQLLDAQGVTMDQVREELRQGLLPQIWRESIANTQKLTEDDLLKSFDEIKVRHILIPTISSTMQMPGSLPDGQAKHKAEQILAKVKGGDFAKLADEYTGDPSNTKQTFDPKAKKPVTQKQGGLINGGPEGWYKRGSGQQSEEFDNAAFALKKGETSGVVKTPAGYEIIKVDDYRRNLPADYAKKKADLLKDLKMQKASKPTKDVLDQELKSAKIDWKDPYFKWRYDYGKQGNPMMPSPTSTPEEKAAFLTELRDYVPKHADDSTAALVLAQLLSTQYSASGFQMPGSKTPAPNEAERAKLRTEIIAAYEQALKKGEDRQARFSLAQLYRENKQDDKALAQYTKMQKLLSYDDDTQDLYAHKQLEASFTQMGQPDLAAKEHQKILELTAREAKERQDALAAQAKEKAQTTAPGGTVTVTGKPGEAGVITIPPAPGGKAAAPKPTSGSKPGKQ